MTRYIVYMTLESSNLEYNLSTAVDADNEEGACDIARDQLQDLAVDGCTITVNRVECCLPDELAKLDNGESNMTSPLKERILEIANLQLELAQNNVDCWLEQQTPFTDQDIRNLRECYESVILYATFVKAFSADEDYDPQVLKRLVDAVVDMEDSCN
jgi:hypothetical protein